ncbi:MAG TPA: 6-phosphogluconate dehydrogenase [Cytophagales bacterium]|nr:6-phosphogluconate dehydrogenase [Cytophagales bacterium]
MESQNFLQKAGHATMKFIKRVLVILLILGIATLSFAYWGTYEKGVMAGKVLRITEKGVIFKTHEGKISLDSFGALKGVSPVAETFDFSVESDQTEVIQKLSDVALSGERVNLYFVKRYMRFPWRGDTKYFVTKVERTEKGGN